jgi:glycosyltransferase involved in cell wall biosynthesis
LVEQIESILNQTYPVHEFIIQDDCSTDQTMDILRSYEKKYTHIQVFRNKKQKGINENFFSAMARATGDYIALSDQDDVWEADKIEVQINSIGDKWLSCGFSELFSSGKEIAFDKRIPNARIERLIYVNTLAAGHSMLLKKEILNYIPQKTNIIYDHVILMIAVSNDKMSFLNRILVKHREHANSATYSIPVMKRGGNNKNFPNTIKSLFRTFKQYIRLRDAIHTHFLEVYALLKELPDRKANETALKIAYCQSKKGFLSYLKLTYYCLKSRKYLFYTIEQDGIFTCLRAIYFPISCSDYFRYM